MVEAAGVEPASPEKSTSYKDGPTGLDPGHGESQVGQLQDLRPVGGCKGRIDPALRKSHPGRVENTTGAQRKNGVEPATGGSEAAANALTPELLLIVKAWPRLHRAIRDGILAMVWAADHDLDI